MEENKKRTKLTQKDYQKKYDKKTKMVSVKYVLSDMQDYDRLMDYLKRTDQTANSFIKRLINIFFEKEGYVIHDYTIPKEYEKKEYYKFSYISDECFEKLKRILGDEEKYNTVLDYYDGCIKNDLEYAFEEMGNAFEEWVDILEKRVNNGEINLNLSGTGFRKIIKEHMGEIMSEFFYGSFI